jgi:hypothetical protein
MCFCAAKKAKLSGMFNGSFTESHMESWWDSHHHLKTAKHERQLGTARIIPTLSPGVKKPAPIVYRSRCKSITQIPKNFEWGFTDCGNHCGTGFAGISGIARMTEGPIVWI